MSKSAHIDVRLVSPSDLPPETDAEFTVDGSRPEIEATLRCTTPRAAIACFDSMIHAIRCAQRAQ